jgi:integrase
MSKERRLPRCLAVSDWPREDQIAWANATKGGDVFEAGPAKHWRAPTRRLVEQSVGRFFGWVGDQMDSVSLALPDRAAPEIIRTYATWLADRVSPVTAHGHIRDLEEYSRVAWPDRDRSALIRVARSLSWRAVPSKDKRSRLQSIPDLGALGKRLMADAHTRQDQDPRLPLTQYRDGLAIAFLALRPLRIRAFGSLQIGVHLVQSGATWQVIIPPDLSKTHRHWEAGFPNDLLPELDHYLRTVRPALMQLRGRWHSDPGRAFWISQDGSALKPKALGEAITKRTGEAFGLPISPHFFRDCAATTLAQESPENVRLATPLLGHTHPKMTEAAYNQASQRLAGDKHLDALAKLRRRLR